jgi:hypothetical protein
LPVLSFNSTVLWGFENTWFWFFLSTWSEWFFNFDRNQKFFDYESVSHYWSGRRLWWCLVINLQLLIMRQIRTFHDQQLLSSGIFFPLNSKLYKKKAPKNGREKETMGKDQRPGKQTAQKRQATRRKGNHLRAEPSSSCMRHINLRKGR